MKPFFGGRLAAIAILIGAMSAAPVLADYEDGVEQDYEASARWYTRGAQQGDGLSQLNLSFLYLDGNGVTQDLAEALKWLYLAKDSGIRGADMGAELTEPQMTSAQIDSARQKAQAWRPKPDSAK
jgi:TPR repeat protein